MYYLIIAYDRVLDWVLAKYDRIRIFRWGRKHGHGSLKVLVLPDGVYVMCIECASKKRLWR